MNYFAHGLAHLDRPHFLAGTALPDWLAVVDRRVRLRARMLAPHVRSSDPLAAELSAGALRHLEDDAWFHATRGFVEVSGELTELFRGRLHGGDGFWCGFLGHVATELLIDAALMERYPARLDAYYSALEQVDSRLVEDRVAEWAGRRPEYLSAFIQFFRTQQYLRDYVADDRMLVRLNQVLWRVKLTPLPAHAAAWLTEARQRVRQRLEDLLPAALYNWPRA
jgi:hypothetical protein